MCFVRDECEKRGKWGEREEKEEQVSGDQGLLMHGEDQNEREEKV